jgi:hypothetical protein
MAIVTAASGESHVRSVAGTGNPAWCVVLKVS